MTSIIIKTLIYCLSLIVITGFFLFSLNLSKYRYNTLSKTYKPDIPGDIPLITTGDIEGLPMPIRKYLENVGVIGTPKVYSYQIDFEGAMQFKDGEDYYPLKAVQTSYVEPYTRLFYMTATYNHIKMFGLHVFTSEEASMKIKLLDIIPVVHEKGDMMRKAETVTIFNDMVLFAPQTLIDADVSYEVINAYEVNAEFTLGDNKVTAKLVFDDQYDLINFISNDRYIVTDDGYENAAWSTPISEYQIINGLRLVKEGKAVWHYEDHDYEYIELEIKNIKYNEK